MTLIVRSVKLTPRPFRCRERLHPFFQIACDIFDHHDRVVDHETGGNGQRH
jgi:hypothetical protein